MTRQRDREKYSGCYFRHLVVKCIIHTSPQLPHSRNLVHLNISLHNRATSRNNRWHTVSVTEYSKSRISVYRAISIETDQYDYTSYQKAVLSSLPSLGQPPQSFTVQGVEIVMNLARCRHCSMASLSGSILAMRLNTKFKSWCRGCLNSKPLRCFVLHWDGFETLSTNQEYPRICMGPPPSILCTHTR